MIVKASGRSKICEIFNENEANKNYFWVLSLNAGSCNDNNDEGRWCILF